mmetsp:Transcript_12619/g.23660  ORF Transcript_12619/g.23660 Transcript_12619/m.23660 type:complete len:479 (-) Transcript_12619:183-1619(-)
MWRSVISAHQSRTQQILRLNNGFHNDMMTSLKLKPDALLRLRLCSSKTREASSYTRNHISVIQTKYQLALYNTMVKRFQTTSSSGSSARNQSTSAGISTESSSAFSNSASANMSMEFHSSFATAIQRVLLKPRRIPIPRWITPRQKTLTFSECFGHMSFVLVAASYATDDFLYLRMMAVAGSSAMLVFTYFHPHGRILWLPFQWNALFIVINTYRIGKSLYYKNIGMKLGEEMKEIKRRYFDTMDIVDFVKLIEIAQEESFEKGELMLFQGQKNPFVRLVLEGELDALRDGIKTYSLEQGNFVTEAGLHAGLLLDGTIETSCTIVATSETTTRCLRWNRTELVNLLKKENGLRRTFKAILTWDIVRKLKGQRLSITDHTVADPELWTRKRNEQTEDRYAAILQNLLTSKRSLENMQKRIRELDHYRTIHHIDDKHHAYALKKIGWSLEEYNAGKKNIIQIDRREDDISVIPSVAKSKL